MLLSSALACYLANAILEARQCPNLLSGVCVCVCYLGPPQNKATHQASLVSHGVPLSKPQSFFQPAARQLGLQAVFVQSTLGGKLLCAQECQKRNTMMLL